MAQLDLTAFDAVLKDIYLGPIREQLIKDTVLMFRIRKTSDNIDVSGRKAIVPILLGWSRGIGARADGGALPAADKSRYIDTTVFVQHNYLRIQVTGPTMRAAKNDQGAFVRAVDSELANSLDGFRRDLNRQLFGNGSGQMAIIQAPLTIASPGPTTVTVDTTKYFFKGDILDVYDATFATRKTTDTNRIIVDDVLSDTTISAHAETLGVADVATDVFVRFGARTGGGGVSNEMMGLAGIISDTNPPGSSTFQGINSGVGGESIWRSKVFANGGVLRDLTLDLLQKTYTEAERQARGPTGILTTFGIRDKYAALLVADKRYVNTMSLDGGFTALEYNGKPMIPDVDATPNVVYYLNETFLAMHQQSDLNWSDEDGSVLKYVPGFDAYEAFLYYDANFATGRRNAHTKLTDIKET